MSSLLETLPVQINLVIFMILAACIWFAGSRLTYLADTLCERFKLAASTVGLVFLALSTSLPEVVTTLTAAAAENANLLLNNLFGGIVLQTAILAIADFWARGAISNYPRKPLHAVEGALLILLLASVQTVIILAEPFAFGNVGLGSCIIGLFYVAGVLIMRRQDNQNDWLPVDIPDEEVLSTEIMSVRVTKLTNNALLLGSGAACLAILIVGIGIVEVAETLASQTGLGSSFIGVTLLAAATSLPELSTTITAARIGAYTLAISNIFGSNLIMLVLVLPADFLTDTPILRQANGSAQLAIVMGMFVTSVYIIGLLIRRKPRIGRIGIDSCLVIAAYMISMALFYWIK